MYKLRSEIFKSILGQVLECHGNPVYKIAYYNKFQGYGLRASDFDGKKGCSRRVFSHWKNFLLERKIIRKAKKKRNLKDKTKDSDRNQSFVITPLGICHFSSTTDKIVEHEGRKMVEVMRDYGIHVPNIEWVEICKIITKNTANKIIKQICDSVNLKEINNEFHIILSYRSRSGISYEKSRFIINADEMYVQLPESMSMVELSDDPTPTSKPKIDDELLYGEIADFIMESFCYAVVENYHWKLMNKSKLLKRSGLSSQKKSNIRKSVNRYKSILEKLPLEMHLSASNFVGYNLFPEITQEQEIIKKIYEHVYNKIDPKTGIKFLKNFEPANIFPNVITKS